MPNKTIPLIATLTLLLSITPGTRAQMKTPYKPLTIEYTGGPYKAHKFKYRLLSPSEIQPNKKYPLVLFLHGAGERGANNITQLKYFPNMMAKPSHRKAYPCFVLAPQCPRNKRWASSHWRAKEIKIAKQPSHELAAVIQMLKKTLKENPIDTNRVYLTGLSMGGYGTWELAMRHPKWFAAVAPICGGGDTSHAKKLAGTPLWAWHGDKDTVIPPSRSREMINAIKAAGGKPKYTELPGVGHNSWTPAYTKPDGVTPWLFKQKKKSTPKSK